METVRKLGFHEELDDCHICPQVIKHSKFLISTSYAQQLLKRVHSDNMGPFLSMRCQERLLSGHWNSDLRFSPPRWSSLRRSRVRLKNHWSIWESTAKYLCQKGISHEVTKGTTLNKIDLLRDSIWPSWTRFAECLSMQCSSTITTNDA